MPNVAEPGRSFKILCDLIGPPGHRPIPLRTLTAEQTSEVVALARMHGVLPLLVKAIADRKVVSDFWNLCIPKHYPERQRFRSLRIASQIASIQHALKAAGIEAVFFKGAPLAVQLYGDLGHRQFNDVDVLVRPSEVRRAEDVLSPLGFHAIGGDWSFRKAFYAYQNQFILAPPSGGAPIDLHWEFCTRGVPFPILADEVWRDIRVQSIGNVDLAVLNDADNAVFLAGHGAKEGWKSLGLVCDFAHLVNQMRHLDWMELYERAKKNGAGNTILLALLMVHRIFGCPCAPELIGRAQANPTVRERAAIIGERLQSQSHRILSEELLGSFELCETQFQKFGVLARLLFTPTVGDFKAWPLPEPFWPLYRFIRPMRLGVSALARTRNSAES